MCGIAGIFSFRGDASMNREALARMTQAMQHRGPDAEGFFEDKEVLLGHRRLSIIDISAASNQPYLDRAGQHAMVYNGELYNYAQVKAKFRDIEYRTEGDTEAIAEVFFKYGISSLHAFKGMFAFASWDRTNKKLTLVRDRFGVKPLYYYKDANIFVFASEVRAILASGLVKASLNKDALRELLSYQSLTSPLTMVEGIHQLEAGHWLSVSQTAVEKMAYWKCSERTQGMGEFTSAGIQKNIHEKLIAAISQRLISDVPLGMFLSGGIDSSAIVALVSQLSATRLNTFNVSFEEKKYDESHYAELVAQRFNTDHQKILLKPTALLDELPNALSAMDSPSGDGINTYVIAKAVKKAGFTVAVSGVGGDELFAGYPFFRTYHRLKRREGWWKHTSNLRKSLSDFLSFGSFTKASKLGALLRIDEMDISEVYPVFRGIMDNRKIEQLMDQHGLSETTFLRANLRSLHSQFASWPSLSQVSIAEYNGYTQYTLLKDMDQMGMANSLEIREPFFDHELVEYVLGIPDEYKLGSYPKKLLVDSLGVSLPQEIVHRKKKGFTFPWPMWLRSELHSFCAVNISRLSQRSFMHGEAVMDLWRRFLRNDSAVHWMDIWLLVVVQQWLEKNGIQE